MERKWSELSANEAVIVFQNLKEINSSATDLFNRAKKDFYEVMEKYFDSIGEDSFEFDGETASDKQDGLTSHFKVTRVQKADVIWDIDSLRPVLGSYSKSVIDRNYEVIDITGLAKYVKSLGGEVDKFLSFFSVIEKVDTKVLDNLCEVGEVDADEVSSCCDVRLSKPWFKVSVKHSDEQPKSE